MHIYCKNKQNKIKKKREALTEIEVDMRTYTITTAQIMQTVINTQFKWD